MAKLLYDDPVFNWKLAAAMAKVEFMVTHEYLMGLGCNAEMFYVAAGNLEPLLRHLLANAYTPEEANVLTLLAASEEVTVEMEDYGLRFYN